MTQGPDRVSVRKVIVTGDPPSLLGPMVLPMGRGIRSNNVKALANLPRRAGRT